MPMRDPDEPILCYADDGLAFVTRANVSACILTAPIRIAQLRELRRESERLQQRYGFARVSLTVLDAAAMVAPDDEVRAEGAAMARDFPSAVEATAFEGGGFRTAAVRAIINGFALFSKTRSKRCTFDSVDAMLSWIVKNGHAPALSQGELLALIAQARAAIRRP
jgi:hypothetical protein